MPTVQLKSADGVVFTVDVEVIRLCITINTMLEDLGSEEGSADCIPIHNVNGDILRRVIEWCKHHKDDPETNEETEYRTGEISQWDQEFLQVDQSTVFALIAAANYLNVKGLLNVSCKTVANTIKGKNSMEIREILNI